MIDDLTLLSWLNGQVIYPHWKTSESHRAWLAPGEGINRNMNGWDEELVFGASREKNIRVSAIIRIWMRFGSLAWKMSRTFSDQAQVVGGG